MNDLPPESGSVAPSSADGRALGRSRYQLIAQIAAAAHGTLWVARTVDGLEEGRIALARRLPVADPLLARRLAGGATIAMDVRDPRVAAVLDLVVTETEVAVVSEYVEGELLRSLLRRAGLGNRPVDLGIALRIGLDLTRSAIAARDGWKAAAGGEPTLKSAVHGALCPDSVLVATYGEPVLLDVGVGGLAFARPEFSEHPDGIPYRAPEQLQGGVADDRTDVYAVGVALWELLANRPLFGSPRFARFLHAGDATPPAAVEEAARARRRVLEMPVPRLDAVVRAGERVPSDVAEVVARALSRRPGDRHPSLDALGDALAKSGAERHATHDDVGAQVVALAGASIEARRLALAHVTGRPSAPAEGPHESVRPTLAPAGPPTEAMPSLRELSSSPEALSGLTADEPKPPPLPKKKAARKP